MYNSPWSWDQTPQNKMSFQYKYITDLIKTRIPFYEKLANSTSCGFNDCYGTALDHFRTELNHNGPADWVAAGAYLIKVGHYWDYYYAAALAIPGLILGGIGVLVAASGNDDD